MSTCDNCGGSGYTERLTSLRGRSHSASVTCGTCDGTGLVGAHDLIEHGPTDEVAHG